MDAFEEKSEMLLQAVRGSSHGVDIRCLSKVLKDDIEVTRRIMNKLMEKKLVRKRLEEVSMNKNSIYARKAKVTVYFPAEE